MTKILSRERWSSFRRYRLSNGWFIDGADRAFMRHYGLKYSIWEPGGDRLSGGAGYRGGADTLQDALAQIEGKE